MDKSSVVGRITVPVAAHSKIGTVKVADRVLPAEKSGPSILSLVLD